MVWQEDKVIRECESIKFLRSQTMISNAIDYIPVRLQVEPDRKYNFRNAAQGNCHGLQKNPWAKQGSKKPKSPSNVRQNKIMKTIQIVAYW